MRQKSWISFRLKISRYDSGIVSERNALHVREDSGPCIYMYNTLPRGKFLLERSSAIEGKGNKKEKGERFSFYYLCVPFRNSVSARVIKFSIARVITRNSLFLEVRSSTFVLDMKYAAFATPRIMASPIIDFVAECRSGVYDRRELSFLFSRFNVRLARTASQ